MSRRESWTICPTSAHHVPAISRLHMEAFPSAPSTYLGSAFLGRLYNLYLQCPSTSLLVAIDRGQAVGFVLIGRPEDESNVTKQLEMFALRRILTRPWLLWTSGVYAKFTKSLRRRLRRRPVELSTSETEGDPNFAVPREEQHLPAYDLKLINMAVAATSRGSGIGRSLVEAAVAEASGRSMFAVVSSENLASQRTFLACGWEPISATAYAFPANGPIEASRDTPQSDSL